MECDAADVSRSEGGEMRRGGGQKRRTGARRQEGVQRSMSNVWTLLKGLLFSTHTADAGEQECKHTHTHRLQFTLHVQTWINYITYKDMKHVHTHIRAPCTQTQHA